MSDFNSNDFIRNLIKDDLSQQKHTQIVTRFPPEPNGYLHIGHAKAICLNFSIAKEFGGLCYLRFDDTNPTAEEQEYVDGIKDDICWLGFDWEGEARYASGYFTQLYEWAVQLIKQGDAYVDLQTPEQIKQGRGTSWGVGVASPYRNQSVDENLALFLRMKNGEFAEGEAVLRAKIDMQSTNVHLRDPILYRVLHAHHHQTGDDWCIYPMYDYAHPLSDAIEGISHSLCTLEFVDHRPLYDWLIDKIGFDTPPHQYESSRLNVDYTITAKRKLRRLVEQGLVDGWDDPRMPTIVGMRRRGFSPDGLRDFCLRVGVSKNDSVVDVAMLEYSIRQSLEHSTTRAMAVLDPLLVEISNFEAAVADVASLKKDSVKAKLKDDVLWLDQSSDANERLIPFTKTIVIDQSDFALNPETGFKRLSPDNRIIRLRNSYVLHVDDWVLDEQGKVVKLIAHIDPATLGNNPTGYKAKGVIHWVSATLGVQATVRLYERLFSVADPSADEDFLQHLNPNSKKEVQALIEPSLASAAPETRFQFEREGYFVADRYDHSPAAPVFNRILDLKDSYKPN